MFRNFLLGVYMVRVDKFNGKEIVFDFIYLG